MVDQEAKNGRNVTNKAAVLLTALEKPVLARVLKRLSGNELTRLMQAYEEHMAHASANEEALEAVGKEFLSACRQNGSGHLREALVLAFGAESADQIMRQDHWRAISGRVKPSALAAMLRNEAPEAVAIVLSQLPSKYASEVLSALPQELRAESVERLARSEHVPGSAMDAILRAIEQNFTGDSGGHDTERDAGVRHAAAMLNQLDADAAAAIVERIRQSDPARAAAIEQEMFHFHDLITLESRTLQQILAAVAPERLALALKGLSDADREPFFAALPDQTRSVVKEEIETSGKVPMREVTAARQEITNLAMQMEREGKIRLRADGDLVA
jgi:flagellar motor switch protein FliG